MKKLGITPAGRIVFGTVSKNGILGKYDEINLNDFIDVVCNFVHDDTVDEIKDEMSAEKQFDWPSSSSFARFGRFLLHRLR